MAETDLISRQAAIDAVINHEPTSTLAIINVIDKDVARAIIEDLPPADPAIIRCKDCKHYNAGFECLIEGYGIERDQYWYCGDAERREDG